ncbi:MAG: DEAD/DEAH box helicase [Solirubrobacteraceae bacterium]
MTTVTDILRDYQREAVAHVEGRFGVGHRRVYVELPTGTGKTAVACELARRELVTGGRVVVVAHRRELIRQLAGEFSAAGEVGVMADGRREADRPITVCGVQTLSRPQCLSELLAHGAPVLLIIDEAHHAEPRNTYSEITVSLERARSELRVLGLTATPFRMSGGFRDFFPVCAFARSIHEMQESGWLCPLAFHTVELSANLSTITTKLGDYAAGELARRVVPHTSDIVAHTAPSIAERRALIFACNVAHARALADAYAGVGFEAAAVWGSQPVGERDDVLARWRVAEVQVVANVGVLGEGFDFPGLAALVMARPTRSVGFYLQALGRITRIAEGKDDAVVIDVTGGSDPRQVLLPHLLDAAPLASKDGRGEPVRGAGSAVRRDFLIDGCPLALVEHDGIYSCATGRRLHDQELAIGVVRDPHGSGLWTPIAFTLAGCSRCWRLLEATEPVPLIEALEVIASSVSRLSDRRAAWRENAPSERALDFLAKLDGEVAREASERRWDAGQVSEAIHRARAARPLQVIRAGLQAGRILPPATLALLNETA